MNDQSIQLRIPTAEDGAQLHQLISECPPLDPNSIYCNLLHCSHFASTSIAAFKQDDLVGFISGYVVPERPDTLFIWQVAVSDAARGEGLASKMLDGIVNRPQLNGIHFLETTITKDNPGSWALFRKFARTRSTELNESVFFDKEKHFKGEHDSEHLARIGPF